MRAGSLFKFALYAAIVLLFFGSLLAIAITGPVVVRSPKLKLDVEISAERMRNDVERLTGFAPRHQGRPDNLDRAADWIAAELRLAGLDVEFQEYLAGGQRYRNVVGFRRGLEADSPVRVIGAHYDAFDEFPGADDNASGVAVLLELVRTLPPESPRHGQYFVAFSTEEPPYFGTRDMGSARFAEELRRSGVEVDLMIALDLIGTFSDAPRSQRFPLPGLGLLYPNRGNFVAVVGNLSAGPSIKRVKQQLMSMTDLPVYSFRAPAAVAGVDWSDHRSFWALGMPAVLVTDTAFLRNPRYHTADDTPDKLDYERMAEVVRGLHGAAWDRDVAG